MILDLILSIFKRPGPSLVYISNNGVPLSYEADGKRALRVIEDSPDFLVGVYDARISYADLRADINYVIQTLKGKK